MSDILQSETRGRVLRLVLNRPEKRNALNAQLCHELQDSISHANHDSKIGSILLLANGSCFSAGMDLQELGQVDEESLAHIQEQLFTTGTRLSKPLVAAVDGPALGGGLGILANCHIVVASSKAKFGLTEIRLGLWPFLIHFAVAAALGERRLLELALTGRVFEAQEAQAMGLVQVIDEDPNGKAMETAENLANSSSMAIRSGLNFSQEIRGEDPEMVGLLARNARKEVFESPDFQEGLKAFREKRQPVWPSLSHEKPNPGDVAP